MKNNIRLPWKAVRRGAIFCAPACGGRCTYAAYRKACSDAHELCNALIRDFGGAWRSHVWENLGWHYKAISPCKRLQVYGKNHGRDSYSAFLGNRGETGGRWVANGKTPKLALMAVMDAARRELAKIGAMITNLPEPKRTINGRKPLLIGGVRK